MTYEMEFSGGENAEPVYLFLCSIGAWGEFGRWVKTLPADEFVTLNKLVAEGACKNTLALSVELDIAAEIYLPSDPGAAATLAALTEGVGVGDEEETLSIPGD